MKKVISVLIVFILVSCKDSAQEKVRENNSKLESDKFSINKSWQGDPVISKEDFVNQVSSTCAIKGGFFNRSENQINEDNNKCVLSKIHFEYEKLDNIKKKILIGRNNEINLYIKKTIPKKEIKADLYFEVTLFSYLKNSIRDSLVIYKSVNYSEALVEDKRFFYIDKNKIFLLDVTQDETGTKVETWKTYLIDIRQGKINLVKNQTFKSNLNQQSNTVDLSKWEGIYWLYPFELSSEKKGNYYIEIFTDYKDFGLSTGEGFSFNIKTKELNDKLYVYDETEFTDDISLEKSLATITKKGDEFYIKSKLIKLERKDIKITSDGYLIKWKKTVEEVPEMPE